MGEQNFNERSPPTGSRFPRAHRLRLGAEFDEVYRLRRRLSDGVLLVFAAASERDHSRLGLSVSRRVGNAVVRNRWKRLIRESFRHLQPQITTPMNLIVIPRFPGKPTLPMVRTSLTELVRRFEKRFKRDRPECD